MKALGNLPYDRYDISDEVREQVKLIHEYADLCRFFSCPLELVSKVLACNQVELARSQLKRAMQRYGSLNSKKFSCALSEQVEKDAFSSTKSKITDKLESIPETVHSNIPLSDEKKFESPRRKNSSISLAFLLSKDADDERSEKAVIKNNDGSKKSDELTIPEDFLCPISLELMKDPAIVSTGQV